jgi:hypothetical protein
MIAVSASSALTQIRLWEWRAPRERIVDVAQLLHLSTAVIAEL